MSLNLDPLTPVERDIGGTTYLIRVLTQREMARFATHSHGIALRLEAGGALDEAEIVRLERCLCLGVAGWTSTTLPPWNAQRGAPRVMDEALLDAIPFSRWMDLYLAIAEANRITEDEAKNSPSPQQ